MARLRYNGLVAALDGSLDNDDTTATFVTKLTHSGGVDVPTITGTDYIPLAVYDANGVLSEIVYLTAYTEDALTGTITRGREGTTGVAHSAGSVVMCGAFVSDIGSPSLLIENGASPAATTPYGTIIYEKRPPATTYDFRSLSAIGDVGFTERGTVTSKSFDSAGFQGTYDSGDGIYIDVSALSDATLEAKIVSASTTSGVMIGPIIATTAGTGAASFWYSSPSGNLIGAVSTWGYNSSFQSAGGSPGYPAWLRVNKSGTNFTAQYSTDGLTFSTASSSISVAGSMVRIGFGSILGTVTAKIEYVQLIPGGGGGLRGWWDGSAIVPF